MSSKMKICAYCKRKFYPYKHILDQKYCSRKNCQYERELEWREENKNDEDYKESKKEAQYKWSEKNPDYWERYRKRVEARKKLKKEKASKVKLKKPYIKISLRKNALTDLSKKKQINCSCELTLIS